MVIVSFDLFDFREIFFEGIGGFLQAFFDELHHEKGGKAFGNGSESIDSRGIRRDMIFFICGTEGFGPYEAVVMSDFNGYTTAGRIGFDELVELISEVGQDYLTRTQVESDD